MERLTKLNTQKGIVQLLLIIVVLGILLAAGYLVFRSNVPDVLKRLVPEQQTPLREADLSKEAKVEITKDGFTPQTLTVKKGTQVTFINQDSSPHHVASDPHPTHTNLSGFDSKEPLIKDSSSSYIFENVGIYTYHDHLNPYKLKGTIVVE